MPKQMNETEVYSRDKGFDMMISYDASNRTEYVGLAVCGSATSDAKWSIYRLKYDTTSGGVSIRRYADSTDDFTKVWDDRASYTYINF